MEFRNIEKFEAWLSKMVKAEVYDIKAYLEEVENDIAVNGNEGLQDYELSKYESITGNTERYSYNVEINEDEIIVTF